MACKMCKKRGKDWSGSDPRCYFDEPLYSNWNCATVNAIRDIIPDWQDEPRKGVEKLYIDDGTLALIDVTDIDLGEQDSDEYIPCLYVQWYKRRGATERLLLLGEHTNREPTEAELLSIIDYYKEG